MFFFAAGAWFCRQGIGWSKKTLLGAVLLGLPFLIHYGVYQSLPGRFPPNIRFICGGIIGVYLYRMASIGLKHAAQKNSLVNRGVSAVEHVGMNSLFYLLMSNLLIFALAGSRFAYPSANFAYVFFIIVLYVIYYFRRLIK